MGFEGYYVEPASEVAKIAEDQKNPELRNLFLKVASDVQGFVLDGGIVTESEFIPIARQEDINTAVDNAGDMTVSKAAKLFPSFANSLSIGPGKKACVMPPLEKIESAEGAKALKDRITELVKFSSGPGKLLSESILIKLAFLFSQEEVKRIITDLLNFGGYSITRTIDYESARPDKFTGTYSGGFSASRTYSKGSNVFSHEREAGVQDVHLAQMRLTTVTPGITPIRRTKSLIPLDGDMGRHAVPNSQLRT